MSLLVLGGAAISVGVAAMLWTELGPGPLDVFITAVVTRFGVPITFVVWGVAAVMVGAAVALGRRPGAGTLVLPLVTGIMLPVAMGLLDHWTPPAGVSVVGLAAHVAAIATVGLGAGAVIVAGLGAGFGELVAAAASARVGRSEALVRTAVELGWLVVGLLLGGTVGVGTVLVALLIGPSVRSGISVVGRGVRSVQSRTLPSAPMSPAELVG